MFRHLTGGGLKKFVGGGGENLYSSKPTGVGGGGRHKKLKRWRRGLLKCQASSFNIFIPPLSCHIR